MTNPRSYSTSSDSSHILLRAKGIGKKKDDGTWLFRNVDFEVKQGVLTVTGASGVGWDIRPELWHSKWSTLSGGEMQRIMLAIGCSFRPEVLLLDEPTSALDEESCSKVEKTLKELNCIWVTHNPQQAKRISSAGTLVMRGGDNSVANSLSGVVIDGEEPTNGSSVKSQSKKASSPSTGSSSTNPSH
ncbi:hypothetical protein BGZ46_003583 [Entomortierella lignicola]|nr:hypothetical protein BGZ46_003583 [Entomortierella lignicola]